MKKKIFFLLILLFPCLSFAAHEGYFSSASDNGITGILETPTARVMDENHFRVFINQADPYRNYGAAFSLYGRLELSGRFTEILNTDMSERSGSIWNGYGNYKDKFIAGKFLLLKEGKYNPALAVGVNDPEGTKLYGAQYVVASKQIYPFDFTAGMGLGRFGDKPFSEYGAKDILTNFVNPKEYINNGNPFFSVNFRPSEKFSLFYEYNPVKYEIHKEDPAVQTGQITSDSKHSIGMRYYFGEHAYATLSWQRGNTLGIGMAFPFEMGKPLIPIYVRKTIFKYSITLKLYTILVIFTYILNRVN